MEQNLLEYILFFMSLYGWFVAGVLVLVSVFSHVVCCFFIDEKSAARMRINVFFRVIYLLMVVYTFLISPAFWLTGIPGSYGQDFMFDYMLPIIQAQLLGAAIGIIAPLIIGVVIHCIVSSILVFCPESSSKN